MCKICVCLTRQALNIFKILCSMVNSLYHLLKNYLESCCFNSVYDALGRAGVCEHSYAVK